MTTITSTELGAIGRYINLGTPAALNDLGAQTIIAYVRPTAEGEASFGYLFGKVPSAATTGLRFFVSGTTKLSFGAHSGTSARPQRIDTIGPTLNEWQHLEVTWDGTISASGMLLYRDGTQLTGGSSSSGTGSVASDAANPAFLMNRNGTDRAFIGDVAYIARWNRVLTTEERTTVRTTGPLDVPSGLVLCWANQQDIGPNALTATARSTYVAGDLPPNTALGGSDDSAISAAAGASTAQTLTGSSTAAASVTAAVGASTAGGLAGATEAGSSAITPAAGSSAAQALTGSGAVAAVKGVRIRLHNGATPRASITGLSAVWWDSTTPHTFGAPVFATNTGATDASGDLQLDIDADTALAIGGSGCLLVYKLDGADHRDSLTFFGRAEVIDIA
jgi:hypothetical protein